MQPRLTRPSILKYAAGQDCANCQLYQGKAGDPKGSCKLFEWQGRGRKGVVQRLGQESMMTAMTERDAC